jgi:hypothetical protein
MFKIKFFGVAMFVFALILAACTAQAAGIDDPAPTLAGANGIGEVAIEVNPAVASGVTQEVIPAADQDENAPYWATPLYG